MKKLQNSLYITKEGVYLHKQRETLLIEQKVDGEKQKLMQLPIHSIGSIFCFGNIMVSPQLLGFCGESGTHLAFFDMHGRFLANVVGKQTGNVLLRRQQFSVKEQAANELARNIVAAKIRSSRMLLLRFRRNHSSTPQLEKGIERLKQIIEQLKGVTAYDTILGPHRITFPRLLTCLKAMKVDGCLIGGLEDHQKTQLTRLFHCFTLC